MKRSFQVLVLFFLILCGCDHGNIVPPALLVINTDSALKKSPDGWRYKNRPFSGYMVETARNGRIIYKLPVIDGKEEGRALGWYATGEKLMVRDYQAGLKNGRFKQWWPNGNLRYLFNYKNDDLDGRQMVFYPKGEKRQESNFLNGKEEGIQRVWGENGQLLSNYTVKDNKIYGIIRVKSCMPHEH